VIRDALWLMTLQPASNHGNHHRKNHSIVGGVASFLRRVGSQEGREHLAESPGGCRSMATLPHDPDKYEEQHSDGERSHF
jgi:hypothetical protein